jgi:hypothetical protein
MDAVQLAPNRYFSSVGMTEDNPIDDFRDKSLNYFFG